MGRPRPHGEWAQQPISLYGRNSASGTYGYFKKVALFGGDYKDTVKEQPGSSAVVQGVASDRWGIGYSGIGYKTADVRAIPLSFDAQSAMVPATSDNAYSGDYPLSRFLYVYVNRRPNEALDPLRREFMRYVFSRDGQKNVVKDGYYPVTADIAAGALASLGLEGAAREASRRGRCADRPMTSARRLRRRGALSWAPDPVPDPMTRPPADRVGSGTCARPSRSVWPSTCPAS